MKAHLRERDDGGANFLERTEESLARSLSPFIDDHPQHNLARYVRCPVVEAW